MALFRSRDGMARIVHSPSVAAEAAHAEPLPAPGIEPAMPKRGPTTMTTHP
jgi:hypothetical protein